MTKAAHITALAGLIIIPLYVLASVVHQGHVNMMMLACFVGLSLSLPNKWLSGFGLYISVWWLTVYLMVFSGMLDIVFNAVTIDAALFLIFASVIFLAVYHSKYSNNTWFNIICISALIQCAIGILQYFNLDLVSWGLSHFVKVEGDFPFNIPCGTLGNPNFLGAYVAIATPLFIRDKWFWFIPVLFFTLYIAHTSMAVVAVVIGLSYFIGGWRLVVVSSLCIILYATLVNPHDGFGNERVGMWIDGIQKITHSWESILFGFGPGIQWKAGDQLHNEYLMTVWNYGLIGLTFLIGFIVTIHRQNRWLFTAFIILCVDMIGNHALHTTPTALLAVVIIVLIERERNEKQRA